MLVGLALLVGCVACVSESAHSNSVSTLSVSANSVTITIPIDIVGVDADVLGRWQRAIDRAWNHGNDGDSFTYCGRRVIVDARFTPQSIVQFSPSSHLVVGREVSAGESYVSSVWHALGTSPTYSPRTGYWGDNMAAGTAAHEFGHLLGLLDEYVETDVNRNGLREPGERPAPDAGRYPDAWFSLMATERGVVLQRHIDEILRVHGVDGVLNCQAR
jgi:hypothetical protein